MTNLSAPQKTGRLATTVELIALIRSGGHLWLLPFVAVLLGTSLLLVVVAVLEYAAPFLYTVF